jgi:hypothetical protein
LYHNIIVAEKLKAIEEWPTLKNKHKRRSLCTYYGLFISSFANIVKLLTKPWRRSKPFSGSQK